MNFDFERMQKSKDALRRRLAAAPIAVKLRLLDALRERALTVRNAVVRQSAFINEPPARYDSRQ